MIRPAPPGKPGKQGGRPPAGSSGKGQGGGKGDPGKGKGDRRAGGGRDQATLALVRTALFFTVVVQRTNPEGLALADELVAFRALWRQAEEGGVGEGANALGASLRAGCWQAVLSAFVEFRTADGQALECLAPLAMLENHADAVDQALVAFKPYAHQDPPHADRERWSWQCLPAVREAGRRYGDRLHEVARAMRDLPPEEQEALPARIVFGSV